MTSKYRLSQKDIELFLHSFIHSYIETEYKLYKAFPAMTTIRALETITKKFRPIINKLTNLSLKEYAESLKQLNYIEEMSIEQEDNKIKLKIIGCKYAKEIHPYIDDYTICIWAALAMVILKAKYGNVRFHGKLSKIIDNGSITELRINKKT